MSRELGITHLYKILISSLTLHFILISTDIGRLRGIPYNLNRMDLNTEDWLIKVV